MIETKTEQPDKQRDRKLGDEWTDWKGDTDPRERDIDEKLSTFFALAAGVLLIFIALLLVGWFMIKPRIEQFNPAVAAFSGWAVVGITVVFLLSLSIEGMVLLKFGRSLLPYKWMEKFLLSLLPKTIWLGTKLGISKDRVGNSFIKMHNYITKSFIGRLRAGRLLILLPRCLKKEARSQIMNRLTGSNVKVCTAAGGEEAREAIREYRPASILAIACERDLMSGIKDVAEMIPVLAVPNRRPEGPCKNTDFSLAELEDALRVLTAAQQES
jgi:hypothetical protein